MTDVKGSCRFCRGTNCIPFEADVGGRLLWAVFCPACEAEGPHKTDRATAIAAWDLPHEMIEQLKAELADERMEHNLLKELLNRPEIDHFYDGMMLEAAHQQKRWGTSHDRDKSAENWYWLVGYLAGKALRSAVEGEHEKARHHTISSAAALFHWFRAIKAGAGLGQDNDLKVLDDQG